MYEGEEEDLIEFILLLMTYGSKARALNNAITEELVVTTQKMEHIMLALFTCTLIVKTCAP